MSDTISKNTIEVTADGPFVLEGQINLLDPNEEVVATHTSAALCRCGHSKDKPFCDGSHADACFLHTAAELNGKTGEPSEGDAVNVEPLVNGPLFVTGNFELISSDGKIVCKGNKTVLCRCGHSENKPFCDGTHKDVGFEAPALGG